MGQVGNVLMMTWELVQTKRIRTWRNNNPATRYTVEHITPNRKTNLQTFAKTKSFDDHRKFLLIGPFSPNFVKHLRQKIETLREKPLNS